MDMDGWSKESVGSWTSESGWAGPLDTAAGMVEIGSAWIGDDGVGDQAWVDVPAAVLRDLLPIPSPAECRAAARSISQETVERWLWSHGWEPYSDMEPGWWTHSEHHGQYIVRPAASDTLAPVTRTTSGTRPPRSWTRSGTPSALACTR